MAGGAAGPIVIGLEGWLCGILRCPALSATIPLDSPALPTPISAVMTQPESGSAKTIDEVLEQLDHVIARAIAEQNRLSFFASLYRGVTAQVKAGIECGRFEDGPRMERLDVIFANRYLAALEQFQCGEPPSQCWRVAFEAAAHWRPIILQHVLLGMNAHINFDLGIAAAQTSPGSQLTSLKRDFDAINDILAAMVPRVMQEMNVLSPWIGLLNHIDPKAGIALINFSIVKARAYAWEMAGELAPLHSDQWAPRLAEADTTISVLGGLDCQPDWDRFQSRIARDAPAREP